MSSSGSGSKTVTSANRWKILYQNDPYQIASGELLFIDGDYYRVQGEAVTNIGHNVFSDPRFSEQERRTAVNKLEFGKDLAPKIKEEVFENVFNETTPVSVPDMKDYIKEMEAMRERAIMEAERERSRKATAEQDSVKENIVNKFKDIYKGNTEWGALMGEQDNGMGLSDEFTLKFEAQEEQEDDVSIDTDTTAGSAVDFQNLEVFETLDQNSTEQFIVKEAEAESLDIKKTFLEHYTNGSYDNMTKLRAERLVQSIKLKTQPVFSTDAKSNLERVFSLDESDGFTRLQLSLNDWQDRFPIQIDLLDGVSVYSLKTNNIYQYRAMIHDIVNAIIVACELDYSNNFKDFRKNNAVTKPVTNDGTFGNGRVLEIKTIVSYVCGSNLDFDTIKNNKYSQILGQYQPLVMSDASIRDLELDAWVIDLSGRCSLMISLSLISKESLIVNILMSILKRYALIAAHSAKETKSAWDVPAEASGDSTVISDFLSRVVVPENEGRTSYYTNVVRHLSDISSMYNSMTPVQIKSLLVKEMRSPLRSMVNDTYDIFISVKDAVKKIPVKENGYRPREIEKAHKEGLSLPGFKFLTVGSRSGDCRIPHSRWLYDNLKDGAFSIMFPSCKKEMHKKSDRKLAQSVVSVINCYSQISPEEEEELKNLAVANARMKWMYNHDDVKKYVELMGWKNRDHPKKRSLEILKKVKLLKGQEIHLGGVLTVDIDTAESLGVKKNKGGSISRPQIRIDDMIASEIEYYESLATEDDDLIATKLKNMTDYMAENGETDHHAATRLLDNATRSITRFDENEMNMIVGKYEDLGLDTFASTPASEDRMANDVSASHLNLKEYLSSPYGTYSYNLFNNSLQYMMMNDHTVSKGLGVNAFHFFVSDTKDAAYVMSNGKSQTMTGAFVKITMKKLDESEDVQKQIDRDYNESSPFDVQTRAYIISNGFMVKVSQAYRYPSKIFKRSQEPMGVYIGLRSLIKGMELNMQDNLLYSYYADLKRNNTQSRDTVYFCYKQVGAAGSMAALKIKDEFDVLDVFDIRTAITYCRMRSLFPRFSDAVRKELLADRGWKFSKKLTDPVTLMPVQSLMHILVITYQKNGGFKDDGVDRASYIMKFIMNEFGFEIEAADLKYNDYETTFKDETIEEYYNRIRGDAKKKIKEKMLRHHIRITYLSAKYMASRISSKYKMNLSENMSNISAKEGTSSMVSVPVPYSQYHQFLSKIRSDSDSLNTSDSGVMSGNRRNSNNYSGSRNVIMNRIIMNCAVMRAVRGETKDEKMHRLFENILVASENKIRHIVKSEEIRILGLSAIDSQYVQKTSSLKMILNNVDKLKVLTKYSQSDANTMISTHGIIAAFTMLLKDIKFRCLNEISEPESKGDRSRLYQRAIHFISGLGYDYRGLQNTIEDSNLEDCHILVMQGVAEVCEIEVKKLDDIQTEFDKSQEANKTANNIHIKFKDHKSEESRGIDEDASPRINLGSKEDLVARKMRLLEELSTGIDAEEQVENTDHQELRDNLEDVTDNVAIEVLPELETIVDKVIEESDDNELADKEIEQDPSLKGLFEEFYTLIENFSIKKMKAEDSYNRRYSLYAKFNYHFWSLLPSPNSTTWTMHSVVQRRALLAAHTAYKKTFNINRDASLLELACFLDEMEVFQTTVKACLKDQYGFGKRIFFMQTLNAWARNRVCEEFTRKFLNLVEEDVLHLPGNEKNLQIQRLMSRYNHKKVPFKLTGDKTKYGDKFSLYVLSTVMAAFKDANLISQMQYQYIVFSHNCLKERRMLIPNDFQNFMKKNLDPILQEVDYEAIKVSDTFNNAAYLYSMGHVTEKDITGKINKFDVTRSTDKDRALYLTAQIATLLINCKVGTLEEFDVVNHTFGCVYLRRTVGFVLGVLNWQGSLASSIQYMVMALVLNTWFEGLNAQFVSHSDDSTGFADCPSTKEEMFTDPKKREDVEEVIRFIQLDGTFKLYSSDGKMGNDRMKAIRPNGEVYKEMNIDVIPVIIISLNRCTAGLFGQIDSEKKSVFGPFAEFLQKVIYGKICIDPMFSATSALFRPIPGTCPKLDTLALVSKVYVMIMNFCDISVINDMLFAANWFVKVKYRMPKVFNWMKDPAFKGSYWASVRGIILAQFDAVRIRHLEYIQSGLVEWKRKFLKRQLYLTNNHHKFYKQYSEIERESGEWILTNEDNMDPSVSNVIRRSEVTFRITWSRRRMLETMVGKMAAGVAALPELSHIDESNNIAKIKKFVTEQSFVSILNLDSSEVRLGASILVLESDPSSFKSYQIADGNMVKGQIGYLNREFSIGSGSKKSKIKLNDLLKRIDSILIGDLLTDEEVFSDETLTDHYYDAEVVLYQKLMKALWEEEVIDVNQNQYQNFYTDTIPELIFNLIRVHNKVGIPPKHAELAASFILESKLWEKANNLIGKNEIKFQITNSLVYNKYTNICSSTGFVESLETLVKLIHIDEYDIDNLSPIIKSWVDYVSALDHIMVITRDPKMDFLGFIACYMTIPNHKVLSVKANNKNSSSLLSKKRLGLYSKDIPQNTYVLMRCIYSNSIAIRKLATGMIETVSLSSGWADENLTNFPSDSRLDNFLARCMFFDKFQSATGNSCIQMYRSQVQFGVSFAGLYLIYLIERSNYGELNGYNYETNIRDLRTFEFLRQFVLRFLVPNRYRHTDYFSLGMSRKSGRQNVSSFQSALLLTVGGVNTPIFLAEGEVNPWGDLIRHMDEMKEKPFTIQWDKFAYYNGKYFVAPWTFEAVTDSVSVDNITNETLSFENDSDYEEDYRNFLRVFSNMDESLIQSIGLEKLPFFVAHCRLLNSIDKSSPMMDMEEVDRDLPMTQISQVLKLRGPINERSYLLRDLNIYDFARSRRITKIQEINKIMSLIKSTYNEIFDRIKAKDIQGENDPRFLQAVGAKLVKQKQICWELTMEFSSDLGLLDDMHPILKEYIYVSLKIHFDIDDDTIPKVAASYPSLKLRVSTLKPTNRTVSSVIAAAVIEFKENSPEADYGAVVKGSLINPVLWPVGYGNDVNPDPNTSPDEMIGDLKNLVEDDGKPKYVKNDRILSAINENKPINQMAASMFLSNSKLKPGNSSFQVFLADLNIKTDVYLPMVVKRSVVKFPEEARIYILANYIQFVRNLILSSVKRWNKNKANGEGPRMTWIKDETVERVLVNIPRRFKIYIIGLIIMIGNPETSANEEEILGFITAVNAPSLRRDDYMKIDYNNNNNNRNNNNNY